MQLDTTVQMCGKMRIYGAGGFGINIASLFDRSPDNQEPGYATAHPVYVDTSRSNLKADLNDEHIFILDGVDGSGKIRRENHAQIGKSIKNLLQAHKPENFNVVIFSASGGSGSVFGPLIIKELLEQNLPVVAIIVGSDESAITAENTHNTLKSLESIAELAKLPVVMFYEHNDRGVKRSEVDEAVIQAVGRLSMLASRQNVGLDTRDITNWAQFTRPVPGVRPRLALLGIYDNNDDVDNIDRPIAIASLYRTSDDDKINVVPDYHCEGYPSLPPGDPVSTGRTDGTTAFKVLHYVVTIDGVQVIAKKVGEKVRAINEHRNARVDHDSIVSDRDAVSADGLIL